MYDTFKSIVMKTADSCNGWCLLPIPTYIMWSKLFGDLVWCVSSYLSGEIFQCYTMKGFSSGNKKHLDGHMQQLIQWHATLTLISPRLKALPQSFRLNQKIFTPTLCFSTTKIFPQSKASVCPFLSFQLDFEGSGNFSLEHSCNLIGPSPWLSLTLSLLYCSTTTIVPS